MSSRYYIYDSVNDTVAEFSTRYSREQAKKGLPTFGRDGREAAAQANAKRKPKKPKGSLEDRLVKMRQNNLVNNANRNPLGASMPVNAVSGKLIGNPAQRTLRNNVLGTSVAGRVGRGALVGGAVLGGAYLAGKAISGRNKKTQEKRSIKGRIKSLLNR